MPWRECSVMGERLRFVARLLEGEGMSEVCRDFGISRKTGYKIFNRYQEEGLDALADRSRRPVRYANQLPDQMERLCHRYVPLPMSPGRTHIGLGDPGRIRTCDLQLRRLLLYPLSYGAAPPQSYRLFGHNAG